MRPYQPNIVDVEFEELDPEPPVLHVKINDETLILLHELVGTGLFGKTPGQVARGLLLERLREIFGPRILNPLAFSTPFGAWNSSVPIRPIPPMPMPPMPPPRNRPKRKHAPRRTRTSSR